VGALSEVFARFRTVVDDRGLKKGKQSADAFGASLQRAGTYIAAYFGINAMRNFVGGLIMAGDELEESAAQLGVTTDALQELRYAAEQTSGQRGVDGLRQGLTQLSQKALAASEGNATAARTFRSLGVNVTGADGRLRAMDAILGDVADGIQRTEGDTNRLGVASRLFGRGVGTALLPLLSKGSAGVAELREEFRALGGGLSRDAIEKAGRADAALNRLNVVITSIKGSLAEDLLPAIESTVDLVRRNLQRFNDLTQGVNKLRMAAILLSPILVALAVKGLAMLLNPAGLIAIAFLAIALAVDDLIHSYETGDGAIKRFLQAHFDIDVISFLDSMVEVWYVLEAVIMGMPDVMDIFGAASARVIAGVVEEWSEFMAIVADVQAALMTIGGLGSVSGGIQREGEGYRERARLAREAGSMARQDVTLARGDFNRRVQGGLQTAAAERARAQAERTAYRESLLSNANKTSGPIAAGTTINNSISIIGTGLNEQQTERVAVRAIERANRQAMEAVDSTDE
jgi:hypothetical protein